MKQAKEIQDIFHEFRNKNINEKRIIELISTGTKIVSKITDLKKHDKNLLLFACLYDNDNLFKFLSSNFSEDFKDSYRECIIFTYVNKNPEILKTSFEKLPEQTDEQKETFINLFSNNCYREENINTVEKWLLKNLNITQLEEFILKLFKNNNKPFLEKISTLPEWDKYLSHIVLTDKNQLEFFNYLKRYKAMYQNKKITPNIPNTILSKQITTELVKDKQEENNQEENSLIVKRKKRITKQSKQV